MGESASLCISPSHKRDEFVGGHGLFVEQRNEHLEPHAEPPTLLTDTPAPTDWSTHCFLLC